MTTTCCKCGESIEIINPIAQALIDQGFMIQCQSCMRGILLPEKPTRYPWHEAPEEAVAAATDEDGCAYWYYEVPKRNYEHGMWESVGTIRRISSFFPADDLDWQNSLEMRPAK